MTTTVQQLNNWLNSDQSTEMPNLSGTDLSGVNLSVADLSGANLSGADLSGANLSYADFDYADLSGADLSGANLFYADLSYADLSGANISRANISRADLSYADFSGAHLSGADLSGADLSRATLCNCIGNNKQIYTLQLGLYIVVICGETVAIGCQQYTVSEWEAMSDQQLNSLDSRAAAWKAANIDIIRTMLSRQPPTVTP